MKGGKLGEGLFSRVWGGSHASQTFPGARAGLPARLEMPSKEKGGGGEGKALAKDEPEGLDSLPNPFSHIPTFLLNAVYSTLSPL